MFIVTIALLLILGWVAAALFRRWTDLPWPERILLISCCLVLIIRPLIGNALLPFHGLFFTLAIIGVGIAGFLLKILVRNQPAVVGRGDVFYLAFLTCIAASVFVSANRGASIEQLIEFTALYAWFWLLRNVPNGLRQRTLLIRVLMITLAMVLAYALHQYLFGFRLMREFALQHPEYTINLPGFGRRLQANAVFGPFLYPPALAGYLVMLLPVSASLFAQAALGSPARAGKPRVPAIILYAALLVIGLVVLVLTRSKGGWLCTGAAFCLVLGFFPRKLKIGIGLSGLGLTVVTASIVTLNRSLSLPGWDNFVASFGVRWEYAKAAFAMISQRPFLGFGAGTFGTMYPLFKTRWGEETVMAHNSFLQIWAESGLFSLLFFLMFWAALLRCSFTAIRKKDKHEALIPAGVFAGLCGFLLHNLVDFDLYQGQLSLVAFTLASILVECTRHTTQGITWNQPFRRKFPLPLVLIVVTALAMAGILGRNLVADYYDGRAASAFRQKDFEQSRRLSEVAIRLDPLAARFYVHLGMAIEAGSASGLSIESRAMAVAAYRQAVRREPYTADYHYRLGRLLLRSQEPIYSAPGIGSLELAAACYPLNPFFREELAIAYAAAGQTEKAVATKQLAEELKKDYIRGTR